MQTERCPEGLGDSSDPTSQRDGETEDSGRPPVPIAIGVPGKDSEIDALLEEMTELFEGRGIDTSIITPLEVTIMPKTPTKSVAIPPKSEWKKMAATIVKGFMPLREAMGIPLAVRGYRPADYNRAVGGASKSRHVHNEALDIRPAKGHFDAEHRRKLALEAAKLYLDRGELCKIGFGVYGRRTPTNIHIDVGYRQRTWGEARHWIDEARSKK